MLEGEFRNLVAHVRHRARWILLGGMAPTDTQRPAMHATSRFTILDQVNSRATVVPLRPLLTSLRLECSRQAQAFHFLTFHFLTYKGPIGLACFSRKATEKRSA